MAGLNLEDLTQFSLDFDELIELPDDIALEMLTAQGEVVKAAQEASIERHGLVRTARLKGSVTVDKKLKDGGDGRYITVYPKGTNSLYTPRKSKRAEGAAGVVSNAEVAFIHEYGAPHRNIKATQFMREANELSADEQTEAARAVYDRWLTTKNL